MKDAKEVTMKNKRKALKGKCPDCGTGMYKILGK
jgi:ssDNA-binding Zn-finger/Zn-ribbon topoisomerase 1